MDTALLVTYGSLRIYKRAAATYPANLYAKSRSRVSKKKFLKNFASKFKHLSLQPIS